MRAPLTTAPLVLATALALAPAPALAAPAGTSSASRSGRSGPEWYARGMELHESGRYDRAIEAFGEAVEAGYRTGAATYNIACAQALKGDRDRAFEWLGKAIDAGFDVASYLDDDDLDALRDDPRWPDLQRRALKARAGKDPGRVQAAVARFDGLMARSPRPGQALYAAGRELLAVAEYDRAARAFVAAAERGIREGTSLYNAACARSLAGQRKEALDLLRRGLDAGFDDPKLLRKDDDLALLRSDPAFAALVAEADQLTVDGVFGVGGWLLRSERRAEAREAEQRFLAYLATHPTSGRAWYGLGYVQLEGYRPAEAVKAFQRALELGYRRADTTYNLACAHAQLGQKDLAFTELARAIELGNVAPGHLRSDRDLDPLKDDPRFDQAVTRARTLDARDRDLE